jgi:hypothetical protein
MTRAAEKPVILSERVRERVEESPEVLNDAQDREDLPTLRGPFDSLVELVRSG